MSMSFEYEPSSEPLHISAKQLFLNQAARSHHQTPKTYVRFVCARETDTAEDTAVHLINNVIWHHGCLDRIIADNDIRLRAGFWEAFTRRLEVDMRHTSPYNPRANGKVEKNSLHRV